MFCGECGGKREAGDAFCVGCGASLRAPSGDVAGRDRYGASNYTNNRDYARAGTHGVSHKMQYNKKVVGIVGVLAVALIAILIISLSGGGNRLVGTWEYPDYGRVYEFTRNTYTYTEYSRHGDYYIIEEGSYSVSDNEIRFVQGGRSWTETYSFVGGNLIINDRVYTRVRGNNFSFEIVPYNRYGGIVSVPAESP